MSSRGRRPRDLSSRKGPWLRSGRHRACASPFLVPALDVPGVVIPAAHERHELGAEGGDTGTLTETYNDVFHETINKTGSWATGTVEGKFTFVPDDPAKVTYTGHFATWFGDENNLQNDVEHATFNVHATGSDGSTLSFHENAQAAMNANGVITVSFDNMRCG